MIELWSVYRFSLEFGIYDRNQHNPKLNNGEVERDFEAERGNFDSDADEWVVLYLKVETIEKLCRKRWHNWIGIRIWLIPNKKCVKELPDNPQCLFGFFPFSCVFRHQFSNTEREVASRPQRFPEIQCSKQQLVSKFSQNCTTSVKIVSWRHSVSRARDAEEPLAPFVDFSSWSAIFLQFSQCFFELFDHFDSVIVSRRSLWSLSQPVISFSRFNQFTRREKRKNAGVWFCG